MYICTLGSGQWKSLAYGAPCIQLMRETTAHNSPFHIKLVIAEVESGTVDYNLRLAVLIVVVGISLWECELTDSSGYNSMQPNFHTFSNNGRTLAVQFARYVFNVASISTTHIHTQC